MPGTLTAVDAELASLTDEAGSARLAAMRVRGGLCAVAALGALCVASNGIRAASPIGPGGDDAAVWAAAPTTVNVVVAAPAVTSPASVVTSFPILLVAIVVLVITVQCTRRVGLSRFGGLYGP